MKFLTAVVIGNLLLDVSFTQRMIENPNADEIISKVIQGFEGVKDFSATIDAEMNVERMQVPKMHADMLFKKPDKVHFSSQGFLIIPRESVSMNPSVLQEHFLATAATRDTVDGKKLFRVLLAAKDAKTRIRSLVIWVDPKNWTITKLETIPYEGRTLAMVFTYVCLKEKYWLPSKLTVSLTSESDRGSKESSPSLDEKLDNLQRAAPRSGTVTVVYSNYKINIGLSDDLFEQKEK